MAYLLLVFSINSFGGFAMSAASGSVILITCVTNAGGFGPGHSALAINGTVYSFQETSNYGSSGSGWLVIGLDKYLSQNEERPVILQELTSAVDSGKVLQYINKSRADDDDYATSGVCSSQAASAIESGYSSSFNTWGIDKPYEIYQLAKDKGIVREETLTWPKRDSINKYKRNSCEWVLDKLYKGYSWMLM
ncbi:MAG: hypothetical protein ACI9G1_005641 [Pirellulaceae bacterium]